MSSKLAIAAKSFDVPSETFIRNHVRMLAPGETALLCLSESALAGFDSPKITALQPGWRSPGPIHQRFLNALVDRIRPSLSGNNKQRLLDFLAKIKPSAILAEYGPTGCVLMDAAAEAEIPLYVHFHGYDANVLPQKSLIGWEYRRLFAKAAGIIVTSEFLRERLLHLGCPPENLHICPCGVDADRFTPLPAKTPGKRILMVSRLIAQKGPLESIQSFAAILPRHPDAVLEIIGEGPLLKRARKEVTRLGLDGRVLFHGAQPHDFVLSRLRMADLLIQHCISRPFGGVESLGLSLIEAMACGVPVISTRHGAIPSTVEHGVTGLLVEEHDLEGMANAMTYLLDDPARVSAMGAAGRVRVLKHFTLARSLQKLRDIMQLSRA